MATQLTRQLKEVLGLPTLVSVEHTVEALTVSTGLSSKIEVLAYTKACIEINKVLAENWHINILNLELKTDTVLKLVKYVVEGEASAKEVATSLYLTSEADLSKFER